MNNFDTPNQPYSVTWERTDGTVTTQYFSDRHDAIDCAETHKVVEYDIPGY